jgi:hypothetical protein
LRSVDPLRAGQIFCGKVTLSRCRRLDRASQAEPNFRGYASLVAFGHFLQNFANVIIQAKQEFPSEGHFALFPRHGACLADIFMTYILGTIVALIYQSAI